MQFRTPPPEMPGEKWHKETYEESLQPKKKAVSTIVVQDDQTQDDLQDDSGWAS